MIIDSKNRFAISNLGWVDKGSLWIFDNKINDCYRINLSDSKYLNLVTGFDDYFVIIHNYDKNIFDLAIHHFENPEIALCTLKFDNLKTDCIGDLSFIKYVPKYFILGLSINDNFKFHLATIQNGLIEFDNLKLDWYYNGQFDFIYQGLIGVYENNNELFFCVQRDGSIYRVDKENNKLIQKIQLAQRYGNPILTFNKDKTKVFVNDYDTLLRINTSNWVIERLKQLQLSDKGAQQFIGSYMLNKDNDLITIARPFSSDVIMTTMDFKIKYVCITGKQPLEAVAFNDKKVVARDWKTGEFLTGKMKRKYFA